MTNTNKDFVFVGNTAYDRLNDKLERSNGVLKAGPPFDARTGTFMQPYLWGAVGLYTTCGRLSETTIANLDRDADGKLVTLDKAIEKVEAEMKKISDLFL